MERTIFIVSLALTGALGIGLHAETRAEPPGYAEEPDTVADSPAADLPADADATAVLGRPESGSLASALDGDGPGSGARGAYVPAFERRTSSPEANGSADAAESLYRLRLRKDPSRV